MKKTAVLLVIMALLLTTAGCGQSNCSVAPSPELTESISQPESVSEPAPESVVEPAQPTCDEQAAAFVAALESGELDMLKEVLRTSDAAAAEEINYWKGVKLNSVVYAPIQVKEQSALYELTLDIADAGETSLKTGKHSYKMGVGYAFYGEDIGVRSITPSEKYIDADTLMANEAAESVNRLRSWWVQQTFATPADIDKDALIEYLIVVASQEENPEEPNYELTQEQIDAVAQKRFGLDRFVHTTSRYYNKEKQIYELWGKDGYGMNERIVRLEKTDANPGENQLFVYVETYKDALQVVIDKTIKYTLSPNSDGSLRFVSALEVEAL